LDVSELNVAERSTELTADPAPIVTIGAAESGNDKNANTTKVVIARTSMRLPLIDENIFFKGFRTHANDMPLSLLAF